MLLANRVFEFIMQTLIAEHLEMGREDRTVMLAQLRRDRVAVSFDFDADRRNRLVETMQLLFYRVVRHETTRDTKSLVINNQRFADGDTWRSRDSLECMHCGLDAHRDRGSRAPTSARRSTVM